MERGATRGDPGGRGGRRREDEHTSGQSRHVPGVRHSARIQVGD